MMNSIPTDLFLDIFSRLPAKSVAKCIFVSKQWASILCRPDFTELFLTRSLTRPRLLFAIRGPLKDEWRCFSSPQPQNPYEKSSLVVAADSHIKFPEEMCLEFCGYASGLIYFHGSKVVEDNVHAMICNPSTGQCASLSQLSTNRFSKSFLCIDPIDKIFKILFIDDDGTRILTLGTGEMRWRKIHCSLTHHDFFSEGICINGVLYYLNRRSDVASYVIVCFDVRSEEFKFIDSEFNYIKLINYKGKFGMVGLTYVYAGGRCILQPCLSVLEDVEKREWSTNIYTFRDDKFVDERNYCHHVSFAGVTTMGEIVLLIGDIRTSRPLYVFYFNPEMNTLQSVEIQGFGDVFDTGNHSVYAFVDHVEDLKFNIMLRHHLKLACNNYEPDRTEA